MEMPKECYNCPLLDGEYGTCNIIGETEVDMTEERAKNCPLVEIEERKVGKWIEERDDYGNITAWHCSNCYDKTGFVTTCAWDYCPSCGSKMSDIPTSSD